MNGIIDQLKEIEEKANSYWAKRITAQLEYAVQLNKVLDRKYDKNLSETVEYLYGKFASEGAVTADTAREAEKKLAPLSKDAKKFRMICVAHAHIDMNWMWRWEETVAVVLDTFRTMLNLMEEYPDFKFSQSQASVYKVVEEHDPAMLEEIKRRIKEGRWEVTASTWVEADKNMPNGESLARHILYTKRTLSRLLDIDPDSLNLDFEPDTFGHSLNVPEILARGGVKYYYHCRGYDGYNLYNWKAPSRKSVIVYREPLWYLGAIEPSMAYYVPEFCTRHNMDTMLKVYGVGDHGGGPTRRDIERITDMAGWPVFPRIKFGTYSEYFALAEKIRDQLPVVTGELNFVFTGCYTSQSRIKKGNNILQNRLNEAEAFASAAALSVGAPYPGQQFQKAWEKVLFNQFHDILPGSCIVDTREYAMGLYQQAAGLANTEISRALRCIASNIDSSAWISKDKPEKSDSKEPMAVEPKKHLLEESISEGAGVGFGLSDYQIPQAERGSGRNRIFHFFNPSLYARYELVEVTVWDWDGKKENIEFVDSEGKAVPHQLLSEKNTHYWGHNYFKALVYANIPAMGYATYVLTEKKTEDVSLPLPLDPRVERLNSHTLENEHLKVVFDSRTGAIVSMTDKADRQEIIDPGRPAGIFRFIEEDDSRGMTAWVVGNYRQVAGINDAGVKFTEIRNETGLLRQSVRYTAAFGSSSLKVHIYLDKDSPRLGFDVECDFRELGVPGKGVPQLGFYMPVGYECRGYRYDIPSGTIERDGMDMDVPANNWAAAMPKDEGRKALTLISGTKHGFRCVDDSISLSLIRGSYDPDPYPEVGLHQFTFHVSLPNVTSNRELIEEAYACNHPIRVLSGRPGKGELLPAGSFMAIQEGGIAVQAIKMPEDTADTNSLILRGFETDGRRTRVEMTFSRSIARAYCVDINERPVETELAIKIADNHVFFGVEPYKVFTFKVEFLK
jgi:alpha-mannosidase